MQRSPVAHQSRSTIENISALRSFVAVVESGSFSEAGVRLNVVPSTVSKHVSLLEEKLHGQLLQRSTKHVSVTEFGRRFHEHCLAILNEVALAEVDLSEFQQEPQGNLRVAAGPVLGSHYLPALVASFLARYPRVSLDLRLNPETVDLIDNGIDVAIRISSNLHPSLVAIKLAPNIRTICASPGYIARHGRPATPQDLVRHNCILSSDAAKSAKWPFMGVNGEDFVAVSGNVIINQGDVYRQVVLEGVGIGHIGRFLAYEDIRAGRLLELFPGHHIAASYIYAVYPQARNLSLKARAFIDHVREHFRQRPDLTL